MELEELKTRINQALGEFIQNDIYLLQQNCSERAIAHRLACSIQEFFDDYHVDCEYNRDIENPVNGNKKQVQMLRDDYMEYKKKAVNEEEYVAISVYPDIIVHERNSNTRNLLIIELKKSSNNDNSARNFDFRKLESFTDQSEEGGTLKYSYGLFLHLRTANDTTPDNYISELIWYSNRVEI